MNRRVVVTGMSVNTPLGDTLDGFLDGLMAGRSAITQLEGVRHRRGSTARSAATCPDYDVAAKRRRARSRRSRPTCTSACASSWRRSPWTTQLSMLLAADGWLDAGLVRRRLRSGPPVAVDRRGPQPQRPLPVQTRASSSRRSPTSSTACRRCTRSIPITPAASPKCCRRADRSTRSARRARAATLRCAAAVDEIRHHGAQVAMVVGAVLDFAPVDVHAMALMGAIAYQSFNDEPAAGEPALRHAARGLRAGARRRRAGARGARRGDARAARASTPRSSACAANSDGNHLPQPSEDGQARVMTRAPRGVRRRARRTSTTSTRTPPRRRWATSPSCGRSSACSAPTRSGSTSTRRSRCSATRCWAAPIVETVAAVLQMRAGRLHPSINIDELDPEVDLDVCRDGPVDHAVRSHDEELVRLRRHQLRQPVSEALRTDRRRIDR